MKITQSGSRVVVAGQGIELRWDYVLGANSSTVFESVEPKVWRRKPNIHAGCSGSSTLSTVSTVFEQGEAGKQTPGGRSKVWGALTGNRSFSTFLTRGIFKGVGYPGSDSDEKVWKVWRKPKKPNANAAWRSIWEMWRKCGESVEAVEETYGNTE